jgi:hypothetical protein
VTFISGQNIRGKCAGIHLAIAEVFQNEISNVTAFILVQFLMLLGKKMSGYRMGVGILMILNTISHLSLTEQTDYEQTEQHTGPYSVTSLLIKKKPHGLSPQGNYTDRVTATCRRSDCQLLWIKGATWSA